MSFTQENQINVARCQGCEKQCKLGWDYKKELKTKPAKRFLGIFYRQTTVCQKIVYPTINDKIVYHYYDDNRSLNHTGIISIEMVNAYNFPEKCINPSIANTTVELARKIARLCDNYKTK